MLADTKTDSKHDCLFGIVASSLWDQLLKFYVCLLRRRRVRPGDLAYLGTTVPLESRWPGQSPAMTINP
jgi:hypothetical protein